jgi:hypothetical protein
MSIGARAIPEHTLWRQEFYSSRTWDNPLWEVELEIQLCSPSGRRMQIDGYWDGGGCFRAAFSPDEVGRWSWESSCPADTDLDDRSGQFECIPYAGENQLYRRGPLDVSDDGTHLTTHDGEPFFWLADTAWNGVIRGDDANWEEYLTLRRRQGFNVIQFVACSWRGDHEDGYGTPACTLDHPIRVHPEFFQRIDRRVEMVNEAGLIAAPVVLWTLLETDIGQILAEEDAIRLARYIVARYGQLHVAWFLGGDGDYLKLGPDRWQRIGRAVFGDRPRRLVTLHPCGLNWSNEEFREEPWLDFMGYQSGHSDGDDELRWLTQGPPATNWDRKPHKPVINLEPNYELAHAYGNGAVFTARHVRRAGYWSTLVHPTAGLTYGHDAIWNWNLQLGPSEGHGEWHDSALPSYRVGLETEGIEHLRLLKSFYESLPWWRLRPAQDLLAEQPADPTAFIAAARTMDGSHRAVYTPRGGSIRLHAPAASAARWFDPRNGRWCPAELVDGAYTAPNDKDWLLLLT